MSIIYSEKYTYADGYGTYSTSYYADDENEWLMQGGFEYHIFSATGEGNVENIYTGSFSGSAAGVDNQGTCTQTTKVNGVIAFGPSAYTEYRAFACANAFCNPFRCNLAFPSVGSNTGPMDVECRIERSANEASFYYTGGTPSLGNSGTSAYAWVERYPA